MNQNTTDPKPHAGVKSYKIKVRSATRTAVATSVQVVVYNQYTGEFLVTPVDYVLRDGDVIQTDPSYYQGGANAVPGAPPLPDSFYVYPDGEPSREVMCYYADSNVSDPIYPGDPAWTNYPDDAPTAQDPGYVEIDPSYFEDYDQYYDESEEPIYTGSDCDTSIGIRG